MDAALVRWFTIRSRPEKAPPQIKRIFVVSICKKSPRGFFRPGSYIFHMIINSTEIVIRVDHKITEG